MLRFTQVDVFTDKLMFGNPVAVVHDADELTTQQMADFAKWTNLSETTFLSAPTDQRADYQVRIFTTRIELPFAGHPTLGSAHAWSEAGGIAKNPKNWSSSAEQDSYASAATERGSLSLHLH